MNASRPSPRDALIRLVCCSLVALITSAAHADDLAAKPGPEVPVVGSRDDRQPGAGQAAQRSEVSEAWDAVKDTANPALLEAFIKRYRNTFFAVIAMAQLADLRAAAAARTSPFGTLPPQAPVPTSPLVSRPAIPPAGALPRAVLYDEDPMNPAGRQYVGTVMWRTDPIKAESRPDEVIARGDVDIPSRRLRMTITFRLNRDPSLPASHVVEVTFQLPADFEGGDVANLPGLLLKSN